jgi:hypothetical protein
VDLSRLRQKILLLDEKRLSLIKTLLQPLPMISGSLYQMHRPCGNPRCKCVRGELHSSWYLSKRKDKKTKLIYIGRIVPEWLSIHVLRHRRYQKTLADIRKIDSEISVTLNQLRDAKLKTFDKARQ